MKTDQQKINHFLKERFVNRSIKQKSADIIDTISESTREAKHDIVHNSLLDYAKKNKVKIDTTTVSIP